jgi:hypothetical protein
MYGDQGYVFFAPEFDEAADDDFEIDWDDDEDETGVYARTPAEAHRPDGVLWITGKQPITATQAGPDEHPLEAYPVGTVLTAELVPEPGNPYDATSTAVAVDVDGVRVGYLPAHTASKRHHAIAAVNATGQRVLAHGTIISELESITDGVENYEIRLRLRMPYPHSLGMWLTLPDEVRARGFTEPREMRRVLTNQFQDVLAARFPGDDETAYAVPVALAPGPDGRIDVLVDDGLHVAIVPADSPDHAAVHAVMTQPDPAVAARLYVRPDVHGSVMAKVMLWDEPDT